MSSNESKKSLEAIAREVSPLTIFSFLHELSTFLDALASLAFKLRVSE